MSEPVKCLVCGSTNLSAHFEATDFLVSGNKFMLMKCSECGFICTSNPPEEMEIHEYYSSEDYISHSDRKRNITELMYHLARQIMLGKKYRLISKIYNHRKGTLLDIGSGTGYFAGFMERKGWKATGVEISERARDYSISRFGIDVITPDKINIFPDKSVDCITLWHVLEHFYDPVSWLKEIFRILKVDGKCILALPNIKSSDSKWFGKNWAALDVPRHLWHFDPDTSVRLFKKNGFRCTRIKGMPIDVFYISIMSYKNLKLHPAFLRGVLTAKILTIKNLFTRNSSSSLIYIIEKE
mgnify:CR=1 FL=1